MRRGRVIARIWHGWAPQATADGYQRHFETQVSLHRQAVDGFLGARLPRRADGSLAEDLWERSAQMCGLN